MSIRSLAVFCGSHTGINPVYMQHAAELGKILAERDVTMLYGGGNVGLMGVIADTMMENGGKVIGVIPKVLLAWERQHERITELIVADDMHERKKMIFVRCDAAMILPGGFGTHDEMFELLTWNQLSIHDKQLFILNSGGFYDHLIRHIQQLREEQFLYEKAEKSIIILDTPADLPDHLQ